MLLWRLQKGVNVAVYFPFKVPDIKMLYKNVFCMTGNHGEGS